MGRHGFVVVDADGHGGEPLDWRSRIPDRFRAEMVAYVRALKDHYGIAGRSVPGGGMQVNEGNPATTVWSDDDFELSPAASMRPGMYDPAARVDDMDLEGIDVAVLFPPGTGEEFALHDRDFSVALCRTLNDARAEFGSYAPERIKFVAKLPMIDPEAAAEELTRCVVEHGFVGMVCPQHVLDRNLDHPSFEVIWATAEQLGAAVTVHGGGQAHGQVPFVIERLSSTLTTHAFTHPVGAMLAVTSFTVGGILHRHPELRVGFMEAGTGWLPFWLERLDEHWEHVPEQAPAIDRAPSRYFLGGNCFVTCEPDERMVPYVLRSLSPTVVCYASDYCHWDCIFPESVRVLAERDDLTTEEKHRVFSNNASALYGIDVRVTT
ncbi:MAG TPA: amidohydrolase family protein [Acidimicrobiia bacterium]|nr:amidohydrolase family protein [Acidimicrobiia bacterium]